MTKKKDSCSDSMPVFSLAGTLAGCAGSNTAVSGLRGAAAAKFVADFLAQYSAGVLILTAEPEEAEEFTSDLQLFGADALHLPPWDILPSQTDNPDVDVARERVVALRQLHGGGRGAVVLSVSALLQPELTPEMVEGGRLMVKPGDSISPEALLARLADAGMESATEVESPGQFSRRGGIIDVYPFFSDRPLRIEFFGDEVDTLRFFDACTQRSDAPCNDAVTLIDINRDSFHKAFDSKEKCSVTDYLYPGCAVFVVHPAKIEYAAGLYLSGYGKRSPLFSLEEVLAKILKYQLNTITEHEALEWFDGVDAPEFTEQECECAGMDRLGGKLEIAFGELAILAEQKKKITVFCNNAAERSRLEELILEKGGGLAGKLELQLGRVSAGFEARDLNWVVTSDQEILGRFQVRRPPKKRLSSSPIANFSELRVGDYVVHLSHGIGLYEGLETIESNGTQADYLRLRFAADARIYVPLSHIDLVQRYIGGREGRPELSKLGGAAWQRRKQAAAAAAKDIAADLLRLQAARAALPGIPFAVDDHMQKEFEAAFPYQETPDQLSALADIKSDQMKASPMDRLLCGDVGFGKTEVAMRAAFKVVNSGKQVAVLAPTTILAEQHLRTFSERMVDYPVNVACLSRFRTPAEAKKILDRVETGGVDILVGTHRILSQDVKFRDLGLVVIDEEQRFGVEQKERLKEMRVSVDILSMSATPIPRTLNMALLGLRDISNLATAPTERQSIRTEVVRYNEELIRRAVLREISRGGQIFFLHNRVQNIFNIARELGELIPEARFAVAHGQMPEKQLFNVMQRFLEKKVDVLVCTTIIESGVDIPSVNTLFVNNADHFGLGPLHQLRGRVGRYRHKAYAYFLIPPKRPVNPVAKKRLQALEEYSELGAGFRLAMRDLEIRGAGNILGVEQSGHIHLVGFELYCRLLEKSVAELKGEKSEEFEPVELDLGTMAYIPTEYIPSDSQRIDFYRRMAGAATQDDLDELASYLRDRYGAPPQEVVGLFEDQQLRQRAQEAGINFLGRIEGALVLGFAQGRGGEAMRKLKTVRRKVTPLDKGRWRVSMGSAENPLDVANKILYQLAMSVGDLRSRQEELDKRKKEESKSSSFFDPNNPLKGKRKTASTHAGRDSRYAAIASSFGGNYGGGEEEEEQAAKEPVLPGAEVIGVLPDERLGVLGIVVGDGDFDSRRFGTATLVCGTERFFMRYTGTGHEPGGRLVLNLRADSGEDVAAAVEANLACGGGRLHNGIVED